MSGNYNLFNDEKVDDLTSTFLQKKYYSINEIEKYIIELLNYYNLKSFCSNISFSNNNYLLGSYSSKEKELLINYKKIIETFKKISDDDYFIIANVYRIILHEIKHILQHKMVHFQDNQLFKLFEVEFCSGSNFFTAPSEVNADIESLLAIIKSYNSHHYLYDKQLAFSVNLINSFYFPQCIVGDFCFDNKINLFNIDSLNKFIYGLNYDFSACKKIVKE